MPSGREILALGQFDEERNPDFEQTETLSRTGPAGAKCSRTGSLVMAFSTKAFHTGAATVPPVPGLPRLS